MRKQFLLTLITALFFSILPAFGQTKSVYVKILRPAVITIPARIQKIVLVDRTCANCMRKPNGERMYSGPDTSAYSTLAALRYQLLATGRYNVVYGALDTSFLASEIKQVLPPLSWKGVSSVIGYNPAHLLIVLEEKDWRFKNGSFKSLHAVWRVYDGETQTLLDEYDYESEYSSWIEYHEVIYKYACRIMPHWEWTKRDYYTAGSQKMANAAARIELSDWTGAGVFWNEVAHDTTSIKLQRRGCFNLSLYYELAGDMDNAEKWITKAEKLGDKEAIIYAAIIRRRKTEAVKLNEQVIATQGQLPPLLRK